MPNILKKFEVTEKKTIDDFLVEDVKLTIKLSQSLLSKGKVIDENNKRLQKIMNFKKLIIDKIKNNTSHKINLILILLVFQ